MKITLDLIKDALDHADQKQLDTITEKLETNLESWAGIQLGQIVAEYIESFEGLDEITQAEEEAEWNRDADKAGIH